MQKSTADLREELAKRNGHREGGKGVSGPTPPQNKRIQQEGVIRLLRADEIECRVSAIYAHGLRLLLFKDARVDQKILDEAFTPFGWKRTHQEINGNLYCTVEAWDWEGTLHSPFHMGAESPHSNQRRHGPEGQVLYR